MCECVCKTRQRNAIHFGKGDSGRSVCVKRASAMQPICLRSLLPNHARSFRPDMIVPMNLELTGDGLTLDDAERLLHGQVDRLSLAPTARKRVQRARRCLDDLLAAGQSIYGVNTGFGKLANQRIEPQEVLALQENLLRSHAIGMGPLLSVATSRLALALRIQALAKGYSGVTAELIDTLLEMYNRGVVPAVPEQGSVGASGDLAPLAHLALVVMGEGHAFVSRPKSADKTRPKPMSGQAALKRVHLKPHRP